MAQVPAEPPLPEGQHLPLLARAGGRACGLGRSECAPSDGGLDRWVAFGWSREGSVCESCAGFWEGRARPVALLGMLGNAEFLGLQKEAGRVWRCCRDSGSPPGWSALLGAALFGDPPQALTGTWSSGADGSGLQWGRGSRPVSVCGANIGGNQVKRSSLKVSQSCRHHSPPQIFKQRPGH